MAHTDESYMQRCLQLASCGRNESRPNPMVGAVIVDPLTDRIIGEGYHVRSGEGHAEVNAFASVKTEDEALLPRCTIYVSLEPCSHYGKTPPCCDLIIRKGVRRVVVGCVDPFAKVQGRGIERIRQAGIEVTVGVLEKECQWLNRRFFTFHKEHRPYIILKCAKTPSGFIDDNCHPLQISTPLTKMLVHKLRAEEDAIVVGRKTWEREHPQLNVRQWAGRSPERFVLTSAARSAREESAKDKELHTGAQCAIASVSHEEMPNGSPIFVDSIDSLLAICYERQLQSLIVEGGRQTLQSFLDRGLWDEIRVETGCVDCQEGTRSPLLPSGLKPSATETYDNNTIAHYYKDNPLFL
ncbi:MAG: bifunctional diaminohydroxyphosphoribosylaminopyrimidine deaminase/5-amino-6-(5-phosphoribosylamino)uracil reductase RibD [Prevotella sp.]|nr:bifunctional diaminohydroxyphosphoribosylaminopyrimidine deaminase/5-amino-6-(5-phosphoribosylamino)uracil reductase RibD [Prevotella sp.]